jgi:meiotically up-regulated gene 157 (Mug157) protein
MTRREIMGAAGAAGITLAAPKVLARPTLETRRPPASARHFTSPVVEAEIARVKARIGDPKLAWMFENCYPNTLDTTVTTGNLGGKPDTFVITGDIDAMWLRDSSAQINPYVHLTPKDAALRDLFRGVIGARRAAS